MLCTDEFGPLGRAEAEVLGSPGLPLIPIPNPLADNTKDLVEAKAAAIVDEVVQSLVGDAAAVAETHRDRFVQLTQRRLDGGELCLDDACAIDFALTPESAPADG